MYLTIDHPFGNSMNEIHIHGMALYPYSHSPTLNLVDHFRCFVEVWCKNPRGNTVERREREQERKTGALQIQVTDRLKRASQYIINKYI